MNHRAPFRKPLLLSLMQKLWARVQAYSNKSPLPFADYFLQFLLLLHLPLYMLKFGIWRGSRIFFSNFISEDQQLVQRARDGFELWVRGSSSDSYVFHQIFVAEEYKPICKKKDIKIIVDAGANVGYSSIYFAEKHPHAFIYALEPDPENFRYLQRNTRHYPNILALPYALWSSDGEVELINQNQESWGVHVDTLREKSQAPRAQAMSLKSLMQNYRLEQIDFLKMDIEGSEAKVFSDPDAATWLAKIKYLSIELHGHLYPGCEEAFAKAISEIPYQMRRRGEQLFFNLQPDQAKAAIQPQSYKKAS